MIWSTVVITAPACSMRRKASSLPYFDHEADASAGLIGWSAPIARALIGARVGDERVVRLPAGEKSYEVISIRYPD